MADRRNKNIENDNLRAETKEKPPESVSAVRSEPEILILLVVKYRACVLLFSETARFGAQTIVNWRRVCTAAGNNGCWLLHLAGCFRVSELLSRDRRVAAGLPDLRVIMVALFLRVLVVLGVLGPSRKRFLTVHTDLPKHLLYPTAELPGRDLTPFTL